MLFLFLFSHLWVRRGLPYESTALTLTPGCRLVSETTAVYRHNRQRPVAMGARLPRMPPASRLLFSRQQGYSKPIYSIRYRFNHSRYLSNLYWLHGEFLNHKLSWIDIFMYETGRSVFKKIYPELYITCVQIFVKKHFVYQQKYFLLNWKKKI